MAQLTLNDEQADAIRAASDAVEVRDPRGNLLGYLTRPFSDRDQAEAIRRLGSDGPWYTTPQVREHLDSLERG